MELKGSLEPRTALKAKRLNGKSDSLGPTSVNFIALPKVKQSELSDECVDSDGLWPSLERGVDAIVVKAYLPAVSP